jgi:hypothetical protein
VRRLALLVATAACLAACACGGSGGGSSSSAPQGPPLATTLPTSGTVRYKGDGRIYTVAPLHHPLRLDDIVVQVRRVAWRSSAGVGFKPPGTTTYGVVTLTVTNLTKSRQTVAPTQIWLRDASGAPFLAAATTTVPGNLLRRPIPPGRSVTGTLVYPTPRRETGYLLVYRFGDAAAIAKAEHVGLVRYS